MKSIAGIQGDLSGKELQICPYSRFYLSSAHYSEIFVRITKNHSQKRLCLLRVSHKKW